MQHLKHLLREDWKPTGQSCFAKQAKTSLPEGNELELYRVRLCEVYINVYFYNISSLFLGRGEGEGGICCYPCRVEEAVHIKLISTISTGQMEKKFQIHESHDEEATTGD